VQRGNKSDSFDCLGINIVVSGHVLTRYRFRDDRVLKHHRADSLRDLPSKGLLFSYHSYHFNMSSPQDILLARGYCYLVQRIDCDERDYSDYSDRRNHDHLSILGCYSTLEEANQRAKAEARRF
jgi:hypothetical protein